MISMGAQMKHFILSPEIQADEKGPTSSYDIRVIANVHFPDEFGGTSLDLTLRKVENKITAIGDPPKPAIGVLELEPEHEQYNEFLAAYVFLEAEPFDVFHKTLIDSALIRSSKCYLNIDVIEDLNEWDQKENIQVTGLKITAHSKKFK